MDGQHTSVANGNECQQSVFLLRATQFFYYFTQNILVLRTKSSPQSNSTKGTSSVNRNTNNQACVGHVQTPTQHSPFVPHDGKLNSKTSSIMTSELLVANHQLKSPPPTSHVQGAPLVGSLDDFLQRHQRKLSAPSSSSSSSSSSSKAETIFEFSGVFEFSNFRNFASLSVQLFSVVVLFVVVVVHPLNH